MGGRSPWQVVPVKDINGNFHDRGIVLKDTDLTRIDNARSNVGVRLDEAMLSTSNVVDSLGSAMLQQTVVADAATHQQG